MEKRDFIRIATWNLERPKEKGWSRNPRLVDKISETDADIWVLTETNSVIHSELKYNSLKSNPVPDYHSSGENFTTILSRWNISKQIRTYDPEMAICAMIESPIGSIIVYGTIITYANDLVSPNGTSKRWEEHKKEIENHRIDWLRIQKEYPNISMIVAGDFNQSRDGSGWYEEAESVKMLSDALNDCSLLCLTEEDMRKNGKLQSRANIDHICVSPDLANRLLSVGAWEGRTVAGKLSDHNGVMADIRYK